jgi:hypothetical protein
MSPQPGQSNRVQLHRHALRALKDFSELRRKRRHNRREELWHSLSHHLRHAVYRSGIEAGWRTEIRRSAQ